MAMSAPLRNLEEEVTCSICFDYLRDPVTIDCGHVFCQNCITDVRPTSGLLVCPLCKKPFTKENIRPVWQLASLVETIEQLKVDKGTQQSTMAPQQQNTMLCERHEEKLHYYCENDGKMLCVLCRESREHKSHTAVLLEKAAQLHREKILSHLSALRRDRDSIQEFQTKAETDITAVLNKLQGQRQCVIAGFEEVHRFLREREQHLLDQLETAEQEITKGKEKGKDRSSVELSRLALVISELESRAQQPAAAFMQDTRDFLKRYPRKKFWVGKSIRPVVKKRTEELSDKIMSLQQSLREFQGKLLRDLEYKTVSVTLDPKSVSVHLQLSEDWKCVTYSSLYQNACLYPQQFDCEPGVLGSKAFTSGKVYWEVELERVSWFEDEEEEREEEEREEEEEEEEYGYGDGYDGYDDWETDENEEDEEEAGEEEEEEEEVEKEEEVQGSCMVGVARESMKRKGDLTLRPEDGVWALCLSSEGMWANTYPEAEVCPSLQPRRVGIALDYEGGTVTFTNAESQELIYTFTTTFTRRLVPFLWLKWPGIRLLLKP